MFIIISVILVIIIIFFSSYKTKNDKTDKKDIIITISRQAARWSIAAKQDKSPLIALLHANYGAAYLWALFDIATTEEIENVTGIDILKFKNDIIKIQDDATRKLTKICPQFFNDDSYLGKIAGHV